MTVIESFQGSSGLRMKGSSSRTPSFIAQCPGSQPCGLKMPTNLGIFVAAWALAEGTKAGNIESSNGSANVTPAPRRKVRRERCFFAMNISTPEASDSSETAYSVQFQSQLPKTGNLSFLLLARQSGPPAYRRTLPHDPEHT